MSENVKSRAHYGLKRDKDDFRDQHRVYGASHIKAAEDSPVVDLSMQASPSLDQGKLESCTASVLCSAYGLELRIQHKMDPSFFYFEPSRLFVYYNSRTLDGSESQNSPVSLRHALKSIHKFGVCKESIWPYVEDRHTTKPLPDAYKDAIGNTISKYERLHHRLDQLKACLMSGLTFVFGMEVYQGFHDLDRKEGSDGILKMPSMEDIKRQPLALHAVLAVGYNEYNKHFKILNSYGVEFGINGYFYMPYDYIMNPQHCFDFWKIVYCSERRKDVTSSS